MKKTRRTLPSLAHSPPQRHELLTLPFSRFATIFVKDMFLLLLIFISYSVVASWIECFLRNGRVYFLHPHPVPTHV